MSVLYFVYAHYMYFNAFPELFTGIVVYLYMFEQSIECNSPKQKKGQFTQYNQFNQDWVSFSFPRVEKLKHQNSPM